MINKHSLVRLFIFSILVILFPLVQKQWLNLYLFDINNLTIYKLLYYLSGIICPSLVIINSLYQFTFYKFTNRRINNNSDIKGKSLLFITSTILIIFSIIISSYIFLNLRIILNFFSIHNSLLINIDIDKKILFVVLISILLIFKKIIILIKKVLLINFFLISVITWYLEINNKILNDDFFVYILKNENLYLINLSFIISIEILYYFWSYISYGSSLSDWSLPIPSKKEVLSVSNIIIFYSFILLYYSILS